MPRRHSAKRISIRTISSCSISNACQMMARTYLRLRERLDGRHRHGDVQWLPGCKDPGREVRFKSLASSDHVLTMLP